MKYIDIPKYRIRPKPERFLIDKILVLLVLGFLLYLFIYVNYFLLDKSIPNYWNWLIIVGLILLGVLHLLVCYIKYSNYLYSFYDQRVVILTNKTNEISYSDIKSTSYITNFIDKRLKTGSILLELKNGKKVKLKYLDNPNQAYLLMQKNFK